MAIMLWPNYLALLSWQGCKIPLQDFVNLETQDIQVPENIASIVSLPATRQYLLHNRHWWKKAEADYKYCKSKNYALLYPGKERYPKSFLNCFESPPILLTLGHTPCRQKYLPVTFVGSRIADEMALNWMDFYLPGLIQEKSICIVSGGARGIDQKAHAIAIRSQKPSLCFLPSGLDHFYPERLYSFKTNILDNGGAFVSCFPPWVKMNKFHFSIRNSLMSAYSFLVVILQAQIRSGTMLTAKKALDYGIPLAVLPGPTLSARYTGNLQLLYDGACMIRDNIDLSLLIESLFVHHSVTAR